MQQRDFLLVGQGLAGSLLAWELQQQNCSLLVLDTSSTNASRVAAGIINPISGMRLVKTQHLPRFLPAAMDCYHRLGQHFQQTFYTEKPLLRFINGNLISDYAAKRLQQPDYQDYLELAPSPMDLQGLNPPFRMLQQRQTGYLDTNALLDAIKNDLILRQSYSSELLDYAQLNIECDRVHWNNYAFRQIIFCEGSHGRNNPWFSWLPWQPSKGELLTLQSNTKLPNYILNFGHWLLPLHGQTYKIGATFDRERIDYKPTDKGKNQLLKSLSENLPTFKIQQITEHLAGIRAGTEDKAPFIGTHPNTARLIVFNGFGAKGCLLIPWHAKQLAEFLLSRKPLDKEADIRRFVAEVS